MHTELDEPAPPNDGPDALGITTTEELVARCFRGVIRRSSSIDVRRRVIVDIEKTDALLRIAGEAIRQLVDVATDQAVTIRRQCRRPRIRVRAGRQSLATSTTEKE